jgi:hypothetical protein
MIYLQDGKIYPKKNLTLHQDDKGGIRATADYQMTTRSFNPSHFSPGAPIRALDPESPVAFLTVSSSTSSEEEGGITLIRCDFTGSATATYDNEEKPVKATYTLDCHLVEVSLAEHPKFKELPAEERNSLGRQMSGDLVLIPDIFDGGEQLATKGEDGTFGIVPTAQRLVSADAFEFARRINEGRTTYLRPSFVWTETAQGNKGLSPSNLNKIGKITTPRGNPPNPGSGRNWMLTSVTQDQKGKLYQTRMEWTLSEKGGHDDFLYD